MTTNSHENNGADRQRVEALAILATTRGLDQLTAEEEAEFATALAKPANKELQGAAEQASRLAALVATAITSDELPSPSADLRGAIEAELDAAAVTPAKNANSKFEQDSTRTRRATWFAVGSALILLGLLVPLVISSLQMAHKSASRRAQLTSAYSTEMDAIVDGERHSVESLTQPEAQPANDPKDSKVRLTAPSPNGDIDGKAAGRVHDGTSPTITFSTAPSPANEGAPNEVAPSASRPGVQGGAVPDGRGGSTRKPEVAEMMGGMGPGTSNMSGMPGMPGMSGGMAGMPGMPVSRSMKTEGKTPGMGASVSSGAGIPSGRSDPTSHGDSARGEAVRGHAVLDAFNVADDDQRERSFRFIGPDVAKRVEAVKDLTDEVSEATRNLRREKSTGEAYAAIQENAFRLVRDEPLSTFSIDVDTASYANVRRFLTAGQLPPKNAVRIEELLNYFSYDYPQPQEKDPFSVNLEVTDCPWRPENRLLRVALKGREIPRQQRAASNLVFLVDVSGSMQPENKLPLVKTALKMLVQELTENDRVSIVTYAGDAGLKLPSTNGTEQSRILNTIDSLSAGGSTHGSAGIELAYEQASGYFIRGGSNRVILLTDGDLNVGITDDNALVQLIEQKAKTGVFLTVLGVGEGNLKDSKMEKLADHGNGVYAYLDGVREARKVLVEQMSGSLETIAKDVKLQIEFNPGQVQAYRLVGYENRVLANRDFHDDSKDAGEIGAGHTVTALYELVPTNAPVPAPGEPLKYQPQRVEATTAAEPSGQASRELLTLKLRFKQPAADRSELRDYPLTDTGAKFGQASNDFRFATSVAMFGLVLRDSQYRGSATLSGVEEIATSSLGKDPSGYRSEFVDLVRKAEQLK